MLVWKWLRVSQAKRETPRPAERGVPVRGSHHLARWTTGPSYGTTSRWLTSRPLSAPLTKALDIALEHEDTAPASYWAV